MEPAPESAPQPEPGPQPEAAAEGVLEAWRRGLHEAWERLFAPIDTTPPVVFTPAARAASFEAARAARDAEAAARAEHDGDMAAREERVFGPLDEWLGRAALPVPAGVPGDAVPEVAHEHR